MLKYGDETASDEQDISLYLTPNYLVLLRIYKLRDGTLLGGGYFIEYLRTCYVDEMR